MDTISILLVIVSLITAGLSLFIARGEKNDSNRVFSLFILAISLWTFGLLMFRITDSLNSALYFARFYYVMAAAIPAFFLHFSYTFPRKQHIATSKIILIYVPLSIITFGLLVDPNFILKEVFQINTIVKSAKINEINYIGYVVYFISFLIISYINLFRSYVNSKDDRIRMQLKFILSGTIVPYIIAMYFDLISPIYDYTHIWIGPLMAIIVVWILLYAVYKHNLLNAKVITTEIFVGALWVFILARMLISVNEQDRIINFVLLLLTLVIGIFLIKSVHNEVRQREHIEHLVQDLEKMNIRLTELDRQKSEFVSFATHQLRAPLTAMKGYASLLLEGDMGDLSSEARQGITRIYDSTNTLVSIVNDYLNISRIELGAMKYAFEPLDLKMLIDDVIAEIRPNIEKSGLKLTFTAENGGNDYRVTADRDKLKQVFMNVIDNSIKYTPQGSVFLTLALDRSERKFVFKVRDTGVGIPTEILPRLFQKFSRADNASKTNIRGTGLGLYVAKQIIEAHHGTIRAESEGEGKGSTFTIELEPLRIL